MPQQPKLRSSCDGCGAAKLKCDRGQPACGRCLSLDLVCCYGVSRKTGKPPRNRLRLPDVSRTRSEQPHTGDDDRDSRSTCHSRGPSGFSDDAVLWSSEQFPDGHQFGLQTGINPLDAAQSNVFRPILPHLDYPEFDESLLSDGPAEPIYGLAAFESEGSAAPATHTDAAQDQVGENGSLDHALLQSVSSKDHNCFQEAYEILGSLSFHRLNNTHTVSESSPAGSASATAHTANGVPLDCVLSLNREARERLSRILACPCAKSPQLALLCTSIISQILLWYQQAAGCTQSEPWSSAGIGLDATPSSYFSPSPGFGSAVGSSTWSSTAASTLSTNAEQSTSTSMQHSGIVTPAKMAIGTFSIDDLRMQTALQIHLLLDEIKRVGHLIHHFSSHNFDGQFVTNSYANGAVRSLYQGLDVWLCNEYSKIINVTKAKLRELNS